MGDCPGPRKETTDGLHVTQGAEGVTYKARDQPLPPRAPCPCVKMCPREKLGHVQGCMVSVTCAIHLGQGPYLGEHPSCYGLNVTECRTTDVTPQRVRTHGPWVEFHAVFGSFSFPLGVGQGGVPLLEFNLWALAVEGRHYYHSISCIHGKWHLIEFLKWSGSLDHAFRPDGYWSPQNGQSARCPSAPPTQCAETGGKFGEKLARKLA